MSEIITRTYEFGYILAPAVPETEVPTHLDIFKKTIIELKGEILSEGAPEFIDLAYTMEKSIANKKMKYSQGYFGWVKFNASPEVMEQLKKTLDGIVELVRYILIKTSVENTIVFKKPKVEAIRDIDMDENEVILDESEGDILKGDHEMLPDLADDIADVQAEVLDIEPEEK